MSIFGDIGDFASNLMGGAGTQNRTQIVNPNSQMDPNAFQYGGQQGGAAARQGQLSQLGAAGASQAGQQPYQQAQLSALAQAQREANGEDFGATQAQLNQGLAQAQAGAASQAASSRGGGANLAAAQNQAANIQGGQAASTANQAAALKAQMQQQGVQNLNAFASGGLGQQMQQNQFNANLQQGYEGMNNQLGLAQLQAQQNQQQLMSQNTLASQGQASQQQAGNAQTNAGILGGLMGGAAGVAGSLASSSDARGKGSIQSESGGRYMSSPYGAKTNIAGESALAARDAHTANFGKMGAGQQTWFNVSNAQPWSPESQAAQANANRFFFSSDEDGKSDLSSESSSKNENEQVGSALSAAGKGFGSMGGGPRREQDIDPAHVGYHSIWHDVTSDTKAKKKAVEESALAKAAAKMGADEDAMSNGFEWMRQGPTAVELAKQPSAADEYMATARPYTYDYKNPAENGGERRLGIMAQNLEQGPTGADLVKDTPRGKVVDVPALASANSAAVGRLHDRVSALEAAGGDVDAHAMPAGEVIMDPKLSPEEHGIFSVYDNGTRLTSDTAAKKDAIFQSGVQAGVAAASPKSKYDLPPPPPPPKAQPLPAPPDPRFIDPEETARRMDARLAEWNQGSQPRPSALVASQHPTPASFQPVIVATRAAPRGSVFAPTARLR